MKQTEILSALCALAVWAAPAVAADPPSAKPARVRVGHMLILFECENTVVKAAGQQHEAAVALRLREVRISDWLPGGRRPMHDGRSRMRIARISFNENVL